MYEGELLFMDILRMMEEQGFRFERPVGWLAASENGEILQMDALFARANGNSDDAPPRPGSQPKGE